MKKNVCKKCKFKNSEGKCIYWMYCLKLLEV